MVGTISLVPTVNSYLTCAAILQTFITNIVAISHRYLTSKISIWMIDLLEKNHSLQAKFFVLA
jgi:hypothetical protein